MGSGIGQIPGAIQQGIAPRQTGGDALDPPDFRPAFADAANATLTGNLTGSPGSENGSVPTLQAGFGQGTVSVPLAALNTLGRGVQAAREVVPSFDELRVQFQQARETAPVSSENVTRPVGEASAIDGTVSIESRIPAADTQGLNAFNRARAFSETDAFAPPEFAETPTVSEESALAGGTEPPESREAPEPAPSEPAADAFDRVARTRFDLTA